MSLTKSFEYDCEVRGPYKAVQVRKITIIKDSGTEISRTSHRHVLQCRDKSSGSWADTDISAEDASVQAVCNALWSNSVKSSFETFKDSLSKE
tara:strand:+ start:1876 stop:2154 length:279 start_codon:yes stop_codon:yes gene_type:complete